MNLVMQVARTEEKLANLEEKVKEQGRSLHHRIDKLEIKLLFWSGGGAAAGSLLGAAGHAAATTLFGG